VDDVLLRIRLLANERIGSRRRRTGNDGVEGLIDTRILLQSSTSSIASTGKVLYCGDWGGMRWFRCELFGERLIGARLGIEGRGEA
jgi:hypothetical protein